MSVMANVSVSTRGANARRNDIEVFTSLRGIACLIVVMAHVWSVLVWPQLFAGDTSVLASFRLLAGLFNGSSAVQMFFVLSACVLSMSLSNQRTKQSSQIKTFYVRRFFRIYPALWASVLLTLCLWSLIRSPQALNAGVYTHWAASEAYPSSPTAKLVALSLMGLYVHLNGPLWTLRVELFYSLAFPAIYFLARDPHKRLVLLAGVSMAALLPIPREFCIHYALAFGLGAAIPFLPSVKDVPYRVVAIAALIALLLSHMATDQLGMQMKAAEIVQMLIAFVAVYCLYHSGKTVRALETGPFVFIGDISYSVYVLHFPILFASTALVVRVLGAAQIRAHPLATLLALTALALCTTIVASALSRRYIERPGERIGRSLYAAFAKRVSAETATHGQPGAAGGRPSAQD